MYNELDPNAQYLLAHDFLNLITKEVIAERYTVVHKLEYNKEKTMITFTIKETGKTHSTFYGYMFALDNHDNRNKLMVAAMVQEQLTALKKKSKLAWDEVDKIMGPSERLAVTIRKEKDTRKKKNLQYSIHQMKKEIAAQS